METGRHKATILKNDIRTAGTGTPFVYLLLDIDGERAASQIWLSKKAAGMARAKLRACGFDTASESTRVLKENNNYLADRKVEVEVTEEEYRGQQQIKVQIVASNVTKKQISNIDQMLKGEDGDDFGEDDDVPF